MRTSESFSRISAALVAAQADLRGVEKSATNPHFKSKYAPLDAIIGMVRPALAKHGCAVLQSAGQANPDALAVVTRIIHESGEWIEGEVYIPLAKKDPQGAGAAVTYGRRFGLSALLSISTDEDDDGNAASHAPRASNRRQEPRNAPLETYKAAHDAARLESALQRHGGAPEDRRFMFKRLGDYSRDDLVKIRGWALKQGNPELKDFARDVSSMLAAHALGETESQVVERVVANEAKEQAKLPFD